MSSQNFKLGNNISQYFSNTNSAPLAPGQIFQSNNPLSMVNSFFARAEPSDTDIIFGSSSRDLYNPSLSSTSVTSPSAVQSVSEANKPLSSLLEGVKLSFDTPSGMAGLGLSALDTALTNNYNQTSLISARQGNGPDGHAFDAINHAEANANFNSVNSTLQSTLIAGGSAFGPEGLAAGVALAGVEEGVSQMFSPDLNTTQGLSGNMTADTDQ